MPVPVLEPDGHEPPFSLQKSTADAGCAWVPRPRLSIVTIEERKAPRGPALLAGALLSAPEAWIDSPPMKWVSVAVLAVIGVLALIVGIIYLTVPIHSLPSFIPGQIAHHRGVYHKRGAVASLIGVVLLVSAGGLAVYFRRVEVNAAGPAVAQAPSSPPTAQGGAAGGQVSQG